MPLGGSVPARSCSKMKTTLSTWTPLNHPASNSQVFEERRSLLAKWFARWSGGQREAVLQDLVLSCSVEQLSFLSLSVARRLPLQAADLCCTLPRALCLYVFSFLDPRSLCRCARVSWHWRSIVELDQLWMPRCVRLGFIPGPLEQGFWKRHYIHTVQELQVREITHVHLLQAASAQQQCEGPSGEEPPASTSRTGLRTEKLPWRDSDRRPKDTRRFNYLDNPDPGEPALKAAGTSGATWRPGAGSQRTEAHDKRHRAKALMFLGTNCRPPPLPLPPPPPPLPPPPPHLPLWASCGHAPAVTKETAQALLHLTRWNAGVRPAPVRPAAPRRSVEALRASRRSQRSAPSKPLFGVQSWTHTHTHQQDLRTTAAALQSGGVV